MPALFALLNNEGERKALEENIAHFARPDAAKHIASEILSIIHTKA
jgi:UDP-N-acetylglucosamine:LPS N-acetylglucosamine transferase